MRKYGIQASILTMLYMERLHLVTKEKVKKAYKGELKNDGDWINEKIFINDDLERFIINLQNQKKSEKRIRWQFLHSKIDKQRIETCSRREQRTHE